MIILFFILNQKSYFASLNFKHQQWEQENFSGHSLSWEIAWVTQKSGKLPEWLRRVGNCLSDSEEWEIAWVTQKSGKLPEWVRSLVGEMFKYKCVFVARQNLQNLFCLYCFSRRDASTVMVESHVILVANLQRKYPHNLDVGIAKK